MSSNTSFAPDEDAATILSEQTWLQGALVTCIGYGVVLTLCFMCFFMLVLGFRRSRLLRDGPLVLFVFLSFALNTVVTGGTMQLTMQAFVNDRNVPGGPSAYELLAFALPLEAAVNACILVSMFLGDALIVSPPPHTHRCTWC